VLVEHSATLVRRAQMGTFAGVVPERPISLTSHVKTPEFLTLTTSHTVRRLWAGVTRILHARSQGSANGAPLL
jgi:hypothetical protein